MEEKEYVLGIDIGGTSIKIGVVNADQILESTSVRNTFKGASKNLLPGIKPICDNYIKKYNIKKIGVGCPGDIENGVVVLAANLGWNHFNILEEFKKYYPDCSINVDNDGNAACEAELKYGELGNVTNGLFITIGRGVGGTVIVDKKIVHGIHNRGGKFGHMVIHTNGRKCNCGRRGCYETYVSVLGLINTVKEVNERTSDPNAKIDTSKLSGYQIINYLKDNKSVAIEGVRKWHNDLAEGLLNLCLVFDPSVIIIAGGITEGPLLNIEYIQKYLASHDYESCEVKVATFKGKTGLVGAAALCE